MLLTNYLSHHYRTTQHCTTLFLILFTQTKIFQLQGNAPIRVATVYKQRGNEFRKKKQRTIGTSCSIGIDCHLFFCIIASIVIRLRAGVACACGRHGRCTVTERTPCTALCKYAAVVYPGCLVLINFRCQPLCVVAGWDQTRG